MKERLDYIDIAKGLGILIVIFSHSGGETGLMTYIGGFFIPLFFVLSGYTLHIQQQQAYGSFIGKKAKRLLVPYVLFSTLLLLLYRTFQMTDFLGVAYSRYCLYPFDATQNIYFMRGGNAPLWFLTSMFTAYMAVWLLSRARKYLPYVIALYLLVTYALGFLPVLLPWSMDTAFLMAIFIWIGTRMKGVDRSQWHVWYYVLLAAVYVMLCTLNGEPNLSVRVYGYSFLLILMTGTIGTLLVIKLSEWLEGTFLKSALSALGRHSLVVFCIQMFLLRIQNEVLFGLLHIPLNTFTMYATSIGKTIVAAIIGTYLSKALRRLMPTIF